MSNQSGLQSLCLKIQENMNSARDSAREIIDILSNPFTMFFKYRRLKRLALSASYKITLVLVGVNMVVSEHSSTSANVTPFSNSTPPQP